MRLRRGLAVTVALAAAVVARAAAPAHARRGSCAPISRPSSTGRSSRPARHSPHPGPAAGRDRVLRPGPRRPATPARGTLLSALGARVLRRLRGRSARSPSRRGRAVVPRVAALPWVTRLAAGRARSRAGRRPAYGDQTRGTPADVGATALWDQGVTGHGRAHRRPRHRRRRDPPRPRRPRLPPAGRSCRAPPKVVGPAQLQQRRLCCPARGVDGHGHGTHVAGIAAGTGEGTPLASDNGKYAGIAPGREARRRQGARPTPAPG